MPAGISGISTSARMLATTISYPLPTSSCTFSSSIRFPIISLKSASSRPFAARLSSVAASAHISRSVAVIFEAPNLNASMDRTPLPVPTSSTLHPSVTYFRSARMHNCVVSCIPVPNAVPGSICIVNPVCSSETGFSHEGINRISSM